MAQQFTMKKNTTAPTSSTTSVAGQPLFHYEVDGAKAIVYMGYANGDDKHVRVAQLIEDNDNLGTSDDKLCTQGNVKAYSDLKAPLASPAFTGNPTVPTQTAGNDSTRIATTAYADTAVSNLVASAPSALNTLNELAAALGDDASFSTTVTNSIGLKANTANPTITGTLTYGTLNDGTTALTSTVAELNALDGFDGDVEDLKYAKDLYDTGVTATEFDYLDGVTSNIQTQMDSKGTGTVTSLGDLSVTSTAAEINTLDGFDGDVEDLKYAKDLYDTGVTATEFDYLDGVTSNLQTQIDSKQAVGSYQANDAQLTILAAMSSGVANALKALSETEVQILDGCTSTSGELNILDGCTATVTELNILDGVTSTAAEINILDGVTATTAEINIMDGVTSTAAEINTLDGFDGDVEDLKYAKDLYDTGVTATEFDYLDGVTSNLQTQINAKGTGTVSSLGDLSVTSTAAELNTLDGFDGDVEDLKYAKDLYDTGVTATEFDYLDGVTSNLQTQIDSKLGDTAVLGGGTYNI